MIQRKYKILTLGFITSIALGVVLGLAPPASTPTPVAAAAPPGRPPVTTGKPPFATKPIKSTTTVAPTTTSSSTTTTTVAPTTTTTEPEPTTTTVEPTTTTTRIVLSGTAPVTDQGLIVYGPDFVGLPIPGGEPPAVQACPEGTSLDFQASSFELDPGLHVEYLPEYGTVMILADFDVTGTVTYELVCA